MTNESGFSRVLDSIWRFFSSVKLTIVILLLMGVAMGYGTFVETFLSNGAARLVVLYTVSSAAGFVLTSAAALLPSRSYSAVTARSST